jgi:hypothetical protein
MTDPAAPAPDRRRDGLRTFEARLAPDTAPGPKHLTVWVRLDLGGGKEWVAVGRLAGEKR